MKATQTHLSNASEKSIGISIRVFEVAIFDCQPNPKQLQTQHITKAFTTDNKATVMAIGRPRINWRDIVNKDIQRTGLTWEEVEASAQDRQMWRQRVALCIGDAG